MKRSDLEEQFPFHPIEQNIALSFDRVSFSYEKVKVLENVSFHIHQGEFVALSGPNGSGKTTVLKLILGLEKAQAGKIELFGGSWRSSRERVGYVPQQLHVDQAFPITVQDVVKMGRLSPLSRSFSPADKEAVEEALEQTEIRDLAARPYSALSGGQKRRVLVARALASLGVCQTLTTDRLLGVCRTLTNDRLFDIQQSGKAPGQAPRSLPGSNNRQALGESALLILDEPTANMDAESESRLFSTLGKLKEKITILIVTHDRDFVSSLVDRVLCMGNDAHGAENGYSIVQHGLESPAKSSAGDSRIHDSRILHEESFPAETCYPLNSSHPLDSRSMEKK